MTAGSRSLIDLYERLRLAWSSETGRHWRQDNPAAGQCGVTALIVHDVLGGVILKTEVNGAWHFYNQIDGRRVDFTMSQFASPIFYDDTNSSREEALQDTTPAQYNLLQERVAGGPPASISHR
jgi:hypothetical protein